MSTHEKHLNGTGTVDMPSYSSNSKGEATKTGRNGGGKECIKNLKAGFISSIEL